MPSPDRGDEGSHHTFAQARAHHGYARAHGRVRVGEPGRMGTVMGVFSMAVDYQSLILPCTYSIVNGLWKLIEQMFSMVRHDALGRGARCGWVTALLINQGASYRIVVGLRGMGGWGGTQNPRPFSCSVIFPQIYKSRVSSVRLE